MCVWGRGSWGGWALLQEIIPSGFLAMEKNLGLTRRCNSVTIGENLISSTVFLPLSPWYKGSTMMFSLGEDFKVSTLYDGLIHGNGR